ncbi:hypothetical protein B0H19DRAFT_1080601 [Mycena capillaripes]|nr:hypothetical protein B0H19DRAFT_1080601 [Mycena capillaripes]
MNNESTENKLRGVQKWSKTCERNGNDIMHLALKRAPLLITPQGSLILQLPTTRLVRRTPIQTPHNDHLAIDLAHSWPLARVEDVAHVGVAEEDPGGAELGAAYGEEGGVEPVGGEGFEADDFVNAREVEKPVSKWRSAPRFCQQTTVLALKRQPYRERRCMRGEHAFRHAEERILGEVVVLEPELGDTRQSRSAGMAGRALHEAFSGCPEVWQKQDERRRKMERVMARLRSIPLSDRSVVEEIQHIGSVLITVFNIPRNALFDYCGEGSVTGIHVSFGLL